MHCLATCLFFAGIGTNITIFCLVTYLYVYVHAYVGIPCNVTRNVTVSEGSAIATFFSSNPRTTFTCKLDQNKSESCK